MAYDYWGTGFWETNYWATGFWATAIAPIVGGTKKLAAIAKWKFFHIKDDGGKDGRWNNITSRS